MESRSSHGLHGCRPSHGSHAPGRPRTYGSGRVCAVEGCGTILSAYNPSDVCALHSGAWQTEPAHQGRQAVEREELTRRCAYAACGREFTTTNPAKKYCCDACRMRAFQARVTAARRMAASAQAARRAS